MKWLFSKTVSNLNCNSECWFCGGWRTVIGLEEFNPLCKYDDKLKSTTDNNLMNQILDTMWRNEPKI